MAGSVPDGTVFWCWTHNLLIFHGTFWVLGERRWRDTSGSLEAGYAKLCPPDEMRAKVCMAPPWRLLSAPRIRGTGCDGGPSRLPEHPSGSYGTLLRLTLPLQK